MVLFIASPPRLIPAEMQLKGLAKDSRFCDVASSGDTGKFFSQSARCLKNDPASQFYW